MHSAIEYRTDDGRTVCEVATTEAESIAMHHRADARRDRCTIIRDLDLDDPTDFTNASLACLATLSARV